MLFTPIALISQLIIAAWSFFDPVLAGWIFFSIFTAGLQGGSRLMISPCSAEKLSLATQRYNLTSLEAEAYRKYHLFFDTPYLGADLAGVIGSVQFISLLLVGPILIYQSNYITAALIMIPAFFANKIKLMLSPIKNLAAWNVPKEEEFDRIAELTLVSDTFQKIHPAP